MKLIFGLGNPGTEFAKTRHNAGAMLAKDLADYFEISLKKSTKFKAQIGEAKDFKIIIPLLFMNESGIIVKKIKDYFNAKNSDILIIHDDSDLNLGEFKIQFNRGSAGHNGIKSIVENLSQSSFWRLRIGIRPTKETARKKAGDLVLKNFSDEEEKIIKEAFIKMETETENWLEQSACG